MKASAAQIRAALAEPGPDIRLYLLHGPDEAGAADLARTLGKAMGPDAERVDLDGAQLKGDPSRLADEAAAMSLFATARHVRVTTAGEESLEAFTTLLNAERAGNPVVAIAPSVKTSAKIVKLALESPRAMAFACYAPTAADAERLAATMAGDQGLRLAGGVARRLVETTGGDRAVMAREIDKLALYLDASAERPQDLEHAALDAVGADLGDAEMTRAIDAVIEGRVADLGTELALLEQAGTSPIPWLRQLVRRLVTLADMRGEIDRGDAVDVVMKRHRVFFREEAQTAKSLRRWSPTMLATAIARVRAAERAIMASGNAGGVVAEAAVVALSQAIARRN